VWLCRKGAVFALLVLFLLAIIGVLWASLVRISICGFLYNNICTAVIKAFLCAFL
jgi:uncharacterized membrane protein